MCELLAHFVRAIWRYPRPVATIRHPHTAPEDHTRKLDLSPQQLHKVSQLPQTTTVADPVRGAGERSDHTSRKGSAYGTPFGEDGLSKTTSSCGRPFGREQS